MPATSQVTIQLYVDDQGTVKIREARVETEALGRAGQEAGSQFAGGMDLSVAALGRKAAALAAAAGGVYGLQRAMQAALRVTEDYQMSVISIAASLTDLAKDTKDPAFTYSRNLEHAREMYAELEKEAARHFAGARQLMEAYTILVNKGVSIRKEEIGALGTVVDKILLMTKGQNAQIQIAQELRALLDGQARATSQVAMLIRDQVGPGWENLVDQHRRAGTLLTWLASLWPGLNLAVQDVTNTLTAQGTTLGTQAAQIARNSGLWQDAVEILKWINELLRQHGEQISGAIAKGWAVVKELAGGVVSVVQEICRWLKIGWDYLAGWRRELAEIAKRRADLGVGLGLDIYPLVEGEVPAEARAFLNQRLAREAERYKQETYQMWLRQQPLPETRTPGGAEAAGGGGRDTAQQYANLLATLNAELTRLAEGSLGAVIGWYDQTIHKIQQYAATAEQAEQGIALAREVATKKAEKVEAEFSRWQAKALGDRYAQIDEEEEQLLRKYALTREGMVRLAEATGKSLEAVERETQERLTAIQKAAADKRAAADAARAQEMLGRLNQYLQAAAATAPLLSTQLRLQEAILRLEAERGRQALLQQYYQHRITLEEYQQLEALRQQTEELKRQALEERRLMTGGFAGGVRAWALGQRRAAETRGAEAARDLLEGAKRFGTEAVSSFFKGLIRGEKADLKKFGLALADQFIDALTKFGVEKLFDWVAEGLGGLAVEGAEKAADLLLEGAEKLVQGTVQMAAETAAQLTAAMSLQTAGTGLTMSAGALTSAAGALQAAAAALAAAGIFHAGGVVMHQGGILRAHQGLALDERLVVVQTGEGILSRRAMARLEARYGPGAFERLNRGEPVAGGGITVHVHAGGAGPQDQAYWNRQARYIRVALARELGRGYKL